MALGNGGVTLLGNRELNLCKLEGNVVTCDQLLREMHLQGERFFAVLNLYNSNLESL